MFTMGKINCQPSGAAVVLCMTVAARSTRLGASGSRLAVGQCPTRVVTFDTYAARYWRSNLLCAGIAMPVAQRRRPPMKDANRALFVMTDVAGVGARGPRLP